MDSSSHIRSCKRTPSSSKYDELSGTFTCSKSQVYLHRNLFRYAQPDSTRDWFIKGPITTRADLLSKDMRLDVKVKDLGARRVFSPDTSYLTILMVDLVAMMMMMVTLSMDIIESDSEVKVVFDETANLRISTSDKDRSDKVYGTNSLLEQWRDSYLDNDDYDSFDDDMYENHDL
nr:hypothetical protein [Tanacetum cinerariifolium]